jgi:hypothetical protein
MAERDISEVQSAEDVRPDPIFMKRIGRMDRRLGCEFNGTHFTITFTTERYGKVNIWTVVGERGEFRQPDQREITMLQEADLERLGPEQRWSLTMAYMEKFQEKKREEARDNIRHLTLDNRVQLAQAFGRVAGYSKSNSAFRRIRFDKGMLPHLEGA